MEIIIRRFWNMIRNINPQHYDISQINKKKIVNFKKFISRLNKGW